MISINKRLCSFSSFVTLFQLGIKNNCLDFFFYFKLFASTLVCLIISFSAVLVTKCGKRTQVTRAKQDSGAFGRREPRSSRYYINIPLPISVSCRQDPIHGLSCKIVLGELVTGGDPGPGPDQGDPSPPQYSGTMEPFSLPSRPTYNTRPMQILFSLFFSLNLKQG